jgi:hypothetical protein
MVNVLSHSLGFSISPLGISFKDLVHINPSKIASNKTTHLARHLGAERRRLPSSHDLLEEALLRLREHELLQHASALGGDVDGGGPRRDGLSRYPALPEPRERPRRGLERAARRLDPDLGGAIGSERDLGVYGAEVEEHGSLLQVDRGEGALLLDLEGVVPGEGERVDMGAVGGDGEAGLDDGQRAGVGEERVAALLEGGRVREGGLLHRGAQVAHEAEVVVGRGGLALRVGGGDVEAQRAVEVRGGRLLLVDRKHHVGREDEFNWRGGGVSWAGESSASLRSSREACFLRRVGAAGSVAIRAGVARPGWPAVVQPEHWWSQ